jgi:hypothetical protein
MTPPAGAATTLRGIRVVMMRFRSQAGVRSVSQPPAPGLSSSRWTRPLPMMERIIRLIRSRVWPKAYRTKTGH